jgi:hypothetical protein
LQGKKALHSPTGRSEEIDWLRDNGLIEVGVVYNDGDVTTLEVSRIRLQKPG